MGFLDVGNAQCVNQIVEFIYRIFMCDNFKVEAPFDKYYNPVAAK